MIGQEWCCFCFFIIKVDLSHSNPEASRTRPCFASCFLYSDSPKTKKCCFNLKSQLQIDFWKLWSNTCHYFESDNLLIYQTLLLFLRNPSGCLINNLDRWRYSRLGCSCMLVAFCFPLEGLQWDLTSTCCESTIPNRLFFDKDRLSAFCILTEISRSRWKLELVNRVGKI